MTKCWIIICETWEYNIRYDTVQVNSLLFQVNWHCHHKLRGTQYHFGEDSCFFCSFGWGSSERRGLLGSSRGGGPRFSGLATLRFSSLLSISSELSKSSFMGGVSSLLILFLSSLLLQEVMGVALLHHTPPSKIYIRSSGDHTPSTDNI